MLRLFCRTYFVNTLRLILEVKRLFAVLELVLPVVFFLHTFPLDLSFKNAKCTKFPKVVSNSDIENSRTFFALVHGFFFFNRPLFL